MTDIEDVGSELARNHSANSDMYFNVKLRSKIRKKLHSEKDELPTAGLVGDFCGVSDDNLIGDDCGSSSGECGSTNCCKNETNTNSEFVASKENNSPSDKKNLNNTNEVDCTSSTLPWRNAVYLRTWGCSHNNSDSEYMAGLLQQAGYTIITEKSKATLWLLNSCTVKTPSETQLSNQIHDARALGKKIVVAGCVSQAAPSEPWLKGVSVVGVQQIDRIVEVVDETMNGNVVRLISARRAASAEKGGKMLPLDLPKVRRNEFVEILAINSGCLNHCTYCKTKQARGDLRSFTLESLVERARFSLVEERCRELWLTSEDLGAWGRDLNMVLPDLLQELVKVIPKGCMMRLGMTNPPYILDYLEEIAEILRHPRVYSFLHIPVQSGSDSVLGEMRREYTREHFCRIMDYMLANVPDVYIATDFICAFPTESKADFEESLELVRKYKFPSLFINQYYPRPGTPAARLKKIETGEAKRRTGEMTKLFHSYSRYSDERIGKLERVLICEMATDGVHYVGHNKSYEHILVAPLSSTSSGDNSKTLLGQWATVEIMSVSKFYMKANVIEREEIEPTQLNNSPAVFLNRYLINDVKSIVENLLKNTGFATKIFVCSQALLLLYFIMKLLITNFI